MEGWRESRYEDTRVREWRNASLETDEWTQLVKKTKAIKDCKTHDDNDNNNNI
jgi:hypothetical protein